MQEWSPAAFPRGERPGSRLGRVTYHMLPSGVVGGHVEASTASNDIDRERPDDRLIDPNAVCPW